MKIYVAGPGSTGRSIAARSLTGGHGACLVHPDADRGIRAAGERFARGEGSGAPATELSDVAVPAHPYDAYLQVAIAPHWHGCVGPGL